MMCVLECREKRLAETTTITIGQFLLPENEQVNLLVYCKQCEGEFWRMKCGWMIDDRLWKD